MKSGLPLALLLLLPACMTAHRAIPHAPPEEAARVEFPVGLPEKGRFILHGNRATAILLALEDFLPQERAEACRSRRESYDVTTASGSETVVLVRFVLRDGACPTDGLPLDAATGEPTVDITTYAVDVRTWRILAVQRNWQPRQRKG